MESAIEIAAEEKSTNQLDPEKLSNWWKRRTGKFKNLIFVFLFLVLVTVAMLILSEIFSVSAKSSKIADECSSKVCFEEAARVAAKMNPKVDP